jgi:BirA family biotin operon repressor/biotin-[acetyl-CoA-carboxylase] ligase
MTDALTPERVLPLLRGSFGRPYLYAERCDSTQSLLGDEHPHGAVAACEEQSSGRGRHGRRWDAPARAALLCSILLRPPNGRRLPELSLVAAVAVAETVELTTGLPAAVKWPNDVLLDGRKVAGILAEGRHGAAVLGVGLNVNQTDEQLPPRPHYPAGSLFAVDGVRRDRAPILAELLDRLERAYDGWRDHGLPPLLPELERRDALRGREVEVDGVRGTAAGIAAGGELIVATSSGSRLVASGEARIR